MARKIGAGSAVALSVLACSRTDPGISREKAEAILRAFDFTEAVARGLVGNHRGDGLHPSGRPYAGRNEVWRLFSGPYPPSSLRAHLPHKRMMDCHGVGRVRIPRVLFTVIHT